MINKYFVVLIFYLVSFNLFSQVNFSTFDPSREWKVIETKYFEVYFPKGAEYFVGRFVSICDGVYEELSSKLDVKFSYKFPVIVSDQSDLPNGYYSPIPWPSIVLYTSRITRNEEFSFDDDLKGIFSHELTHALVSEEANGIMGIFKLIFGYYIVPNLYLPGNLIESITVLNESSWGFGRLNNPIFIDEIKSQVFYDCFRGFYKSSLVKDFPIDTWYLYGGMFFDYLVKKYGYEKIIKFYKENTYYLPNAFYFSFFDVFGTDILTEWNDFKRNLSLRVSNIVYSNNLDRLSFEGYYKESVVRYGNFLFYQQSKTQDRLPSLRFIDLKTGKVKDLMYNRYIEKFDINDGIISFVELEFSKYYRKNVLKVAKINSNENNFWLSDEKVLPLSGVYDVKVKDKNTIYFIVEKNLSNEVKVYDLMRNICNIILPYSGVVYKGIDVNDNYLAVIISEGGKDRIALFEINEYKLVKEITNFYLIESVRLYDRRVLFSAQNSGKIEVFEYDFNNDSIKKVVSSRFSFLKPLEFQDKVYGISFSRDGYDVFSTEKIYSDISEVDYSKNIINTNMLSLTSVYSNFESMNYSYFNNMSILRSLMTFFPIIGFDYTDGVSISKLGFSFNFYDEPLEFRNYFILLDWNFYSKAIDYSFSFIDSSIPYFLWGFSISRDYWNLSDEVLRNLGYDGGVYTFDYFKIGISGNLGNQSLWVYPFLFFSVPSFNIRDSFDSIWPYYNFSDSPKGFVSPYFTLGFSISTLSSSLGAITSEEGIFFNFNSKVASSLFNSQKDFVLSSLFLMPSHRLWANNIFKFGFSLRSVVFSNFDRGFSYGGFLYSVLLPVEEGNALEVSLLSYSDYSEYGSNYFVGFAKIYFKLFDLNEGIWPLYLTSFWTEVGISGGILFNDLDDLKSRVFRFESSLGVFFSLNLVGQLENKIGVEMRYNFDREIFYYYPTFEIGFGF